MYWKATTAVAGTELLAATTSGAGGGKSRVLVSGALLDITYGVSTVRGKSNVAAIGSGLAVGYGTSTASGACTMTVFGNELAFSYGAATVRGGCSVFADGQETAVVSNFVSLDEYLFTSKNDVEAMRTSIARAKSLILADECDVAFSMLKQTAPNTIGVKQLVM